MKVTYRLYIINKQTYLYKEDPNSLNRLYFDVNIWYKSHFKNFKHMDSYAMKLDYLIEYIE